MTRSETAAGLPRGARFAVGALVVASLGLVGYALAKARPVGDGALVAACEDDALAWWRELEALAEEAGRVAGAVPDDDRLTLFQALEGLLPTTDGVSLRVVDAFDVARAWGGTGVPQDLDLGGLPAEGRAVRASYRSATLLAVSPIEVRGLRAVAARTFSTRRWPEPLPGSLERSVVWGPLTQVVPADGTLPVRPASTPALVIRRTEPASRGTPPTLPLTAGLALGGLACALWGWLGPRQARLRQALGSVTAGGLWSIASGAGAWGAAAVALGLAAVHAAEARREGPRPLPAWMAGLGAVLGAWLTAELLQRAFGPLDVGGALVGDVPATVLWLGHFLVTLALLVLAGRAAKTATRVPLWATLAGGLALVAAGASTGAPWAAASLLAAAAVLLSPRFVQAAGERRAGAGLALVLTAAWVSGICGEATFRSRFAREIDRGLLDELAPPEGEALEAARRRIQGYFNTLDLEDLTPADPDELAAFDLAFAVWSDAPLEPQRALSAVAVEPFDGESSSFGLGLSLTGGRLSGWPEADANPFGTYLWDYTLLTEEAMIRRRGQPWGLVRWWLLPQPGFGLRGDPAEGISRRLLRGGPGLPESAARRLAPARYGLFSPDGEPLTASWEAAPRLAEALRDGASGRVETPEGSARVWTAREGDGSRALFLFRPGPLGALERVGSAALGSLLVVAGLALVALAVRSGRAAFRRRLLRPLRSYSWRLVVVFSALVLAPTVAFNFLILGGMARRLEREHLSRGVAALEAARQVLGEYAAAQQTGTGINTVLDDELITWLSQVTRHEVNLYFGGRVYATSKRELFTAGLLPERIPGEVFARLTLLREGVVSRPNRVAGVAYREVYAPVPIPGEPRAGTNLLVSVPLVTQADEVAAEMAAVRKTVLVATAGLVVLLAGLGARLARGFTTPLRHILEGTRGIAAGAPSLGIATPRVDELATLVTAIDRMAERIDSARQELLREKAVVERVVANVTSGVVSVDAEGRVLLQNAAAHELLGTRVGTSLREHVRSHPELGSVAEFLEAAPALRRGAARLPGPTAEQSREWTLAWLPLAGQGEPSALFVVEDVSDVVRSQRLEAWAEMARMIAHEIKNPLTPIRLSAEHLREVRRTDPGEFDAVFERCTTNILSHVDELQEIASEFSTYSRIPKIEPQPGDLNDVVDGLVAGYRAAPPPGVRIETQLAEGPAPARFDRRLLGRALRNLLENAVRASPPGGTVLTRLSTRNGRHLVEIEDDGPGVPEAHLDRIFEPYFSTHDSGTGLGLPIARRIVEEHGGSLRAENRTVGGLRLSVELPAGVDAA